MKMMIGALVGAIALVAVGFTYEVQRGVTTESIVDIRVVMVGGHEYVVATSCSPRNSGLPTRSNIYSDRNVAVSSSSVMLECAASSIALTHHVGCSACAKGASR